MVSARGCQLRRQRKQPLRCCSQGAPQHARQREHSRHDLHLHGSCRHAGSMKRHWVQPPIFHSESLPPGQASEGCSRVGRPRRLTHRLRAELVHAVPSRTTCCMEERAARGAREHVAQRSA
eukprot:365252-Chlamydomonas_euryale.AAC.41